MNESLFIKWVKENFPGIIISVTNKLNDSKTPLRYRFKTMLKPIFSATGKWEALSSSNSLVAADLVAMDSSLPLKMRDSMSSASGDIYKMGIEFQMNETQLTTLNTMIRSGSPKAEIMRKIFEDTPRVIGGMYERQELMFLQGLSTGYALVEEDDANTGIGVRLDYKYLPENKFGVSKVWSDPTSTPIKDIADKVLKKAVEDGNAPNRALTDRATIYNILNTDEAKMLVAYQGRFFGDLTNVPSPDLATLNNAIQARHGFVIEEVERTITLSKGKIKKKIKPWAAGAVVFIQNEVVGDLVWAELAEMKTKVPGVQYQTVDSYILVSKFSTNRPALSEFTTGQARCVPVITNVDEIYLIDSTTVQA